MKRVLCLLLIALNLPNVLKSQEIQLYAASDAKQVIVGSHVELTYSVENASVDPIVLPDFSPFKLVSAPKRGNAMSIVNGIRTSTQMLSVTLQTVKTGRFTIRPATIKIKGKRYSSNSVELEVISRNKKSQKNLPSSFVRMECASSEAYVGSQVNIELKLFSTEAVSYADIIAKPDFKNLFAGQIFVQQSGSVKEVYLGRQYQTMVLQTMRLLPQNAGLYKISPYLVKAVINDGDGNMQRELESNAIELNILPLPAYPPKSFNGAVGVFVMGVELSKREASRDELLALTVKISGEGDGRRIFPPIMPDTDSIEYFEPKLLQDSEQSGHIDKVYEFPFRARFPGKYQIQSAFTYFNTIRRQFINIVSPSLELKINSEKIGLVQEPVQMKTDEHSLMVLLEYFTGAMFLVSFSALAFFIWLRKRKNGLKMSVEVKPVLEIKQLEKGHYVTTILQEAADCLRDKHTDRFYLLINKSLSAQLREYIHSQDASTIDMLRSLRFTSMSYLVAEIEDIYSETNAVLYGKASSSIDPEVLLARTKMAISKMR